MRRRRVGGLGPIPLPRAEVTAGDEVGSDASGWPNVSIGNGIEIANVPLLKPEIITATPFRLPDTAAIPSFSGMEQSQLTQYLPVLMLFAVAIACTAGMLVLSVLLGKRGRRNCVKDGAYECGMVPVGQGNTRFSVKFYLVAMLFILFDIEVVFLYPWAVVYRYMLSEVATRNMILFAMVSFLGVLFVGYLYALKKRAFDWKS